MKYNEHIYSISVKIYCRKSLRTKGIKMYIAPWKNKSKNMWRRLQENWIYLFLFVLICFTHCYKLTSIPNGINVDEAGIYYDSWNLLHYGIDRHQNSWPLYLENYGGGMSILYVYMLIPLVYLFGPSLLIVRIPIVISTLLTAIYGLKIIQLRKFDNKWLGYAFLFAMGVMPIFVVMFRFALDCNLMLGVSTIFLYYFLKAIETGKSRNYILAGFCGGVLLYTYILSHIVLPVFLLFEVIFLIIHKRFDLKKWILMAVPMGVLAFPLIWIHIINLFDLEQRKLGVFTLTKLASYSGRTGQLSIANMFRSIPEVFKCMFLHDAERYDTVERFTTMFGFSVVLAVLGIFVSVRNCKKDKANIVTPAILFWFLAEFLMGCLQGTTGLTSYKINAIFFALLFIELEGFNQIVLWVQAKGKYCRIIIGLFFIYYIGMGVGFLKYYFFDYVTDTYPIYLMAGDMRAAAECAEMISSEEQDIYIGYVHQAQMYYTIAKLPSPYEQTFSSNEYGKVHYYLPDVIDYTATYIVRNTESDYLEQLRNLCFEEKICGEYSVFWNDWGSYTEVKQEINYTVDNLDAAEDGRVTFGGWSLNPVTGLPWQMILLESENMTYSSVKNQRTDVSAVVGTSLVDNCGYIFRIPTGVDDNAEIIFVDAENKLIYKQKLELPNE